MAAWWDLDLLAESPRGILARVERETGLVLKGTEATLPRPPTAVEFTRISGETPGDDRRVAEEKREPVQPGAGGTR